MDARTDFSGCGVCGKATKAKHLGTNACRACASFFKRAVIENKRYKCKGGQFSCNVRNLDDKTLPCKACRYLKCQELMIQINLNETIYTRNGLYSGNNRGADYSSVPALRRMVEGYDVYCDHQLENIKKMHPNIDFTMGTFITPQKRYIFEADCQSIKGLMRMLTEHFGPFKKLSQNDRINVLSLAHPEIRFYHECCLTSQVCPSTTDPKVVFSPVYWADLTNINFKWWFKDYLNPDEMDWYFKTIMPLAPMYVGLINEFKKLGMQKADAVVLMFLALYKHIEFRDLLSKEMKAFKDRVMAEWSIHLKQRFGDKAPERLTKFMMFYGKVDKMHMDTAHSRTQLKVLRNGKSDFSDCLIEEELMRLKIGE
ncbi:unnamed protein product [Bursaphelenchus xylophilus]|uniref:(pine wood nematode) hypothetical protein n=1 Tax=Bursaphelenchus xylophilus TaxID=6326 RepID=A0A7I8X7Y1_BURXY|nr:unnamed protein product [Bursaphelenchus xylophilus]CAG9125852.1 unnamed protein product [Bursaphelenchus xylophilus]